MNSITPKSKLLQVQLQKLRAVDLPGHALYSLGFLDLPKEMAPRLLRMPFPAAPSTGGFVTWDLPLLNLANECLAKRDHVSLHLEDIPGDPAAECLLIFAERSIGFTPSKQQAAATVHALARLRRPTLVKERLGASSLEDLCKAFRLSPNTARKWR
jgi:hypothetical protein